MQIPVNFRQNLLNPLAIVSFKTTFAKCEEIVFSLFKATLAECEEIIFDYLKRSSPNVKKLFFII